MPGLQAADAGAYRRPGVACLFHGSAARHFDGTFEYTPRATQPRLSLDPSLGKESKAEKVGNCRVRSFQGEVAAINDNDGEGGFDFREVKIAIIKRVGPAPLSKMTTRTNTGSDQTAQSIVWLCSPGG